MHFFSIASMYILYVYICVYLTLCLQAAQLSKKEIEDLLKKGAYGAVMEGDDDANQ